MEKIIPQTSKSLQEAIKNRYLHQRVLLDEVVLNILYKSSDKALNERVNFKNLDGYLKLTRSFNALSLDGYR